MSASVEDQPVKTKTQNGSDRSGKALDESHLVLKLKYAENDAEYKKVMIETD